MGGFSLLFNPIIQYWLEVGLKFIHKTCINFNTLTGTLPLQAPGFDY